MEYLYGALIFIYGLVIGSFLNVVIYRVPRKIFFKSATSYCPECKHKLAWYDMIPLFSYIFLGGRCRYCKERISLRYPIVELLNAVLWLLAYIFFRNAIYDLILFAIMFSVLIVVSSIDIDIMEIPNGTVLLIIVLGLIRFILSFFMGDVKWYEYLLGMVALSFPLIIITLITHGAIGFGDIKLSFAVGLLLGWKLVLLGAFLGIVLAGIIGIIMMVRPNKNKVMPLGPCLCIGWVIAVFCGNDLISLLFTI